MDAYHVSSVARQVDGRVRSVRLSRRHKLHRIDGLEQSRVICKNYSNFKEIQSTVELRRET